ncbi:hypothetical protein GQ53DRAFT_748714 [Thozetella sp. PMI_491]|nr:hypothetical protein GQ53DRAFT_748714 [Thozetella sp. PMI_491]
MDDWVARQAKDFGDFKKRKESASDGVGVLGYGTAEGQWVGHFLLAFSFLGCICFMIENNVTTFGGVPFYL